MKYTCHACGFNIGDPPVLPCSKCGCQVGRERNESTDDLSRIRHALCIALGVNPALNEPTYDLLLRLIARGPKPRRHRITLDKSALSLSPEDLSRLAEFDPSTYAPCVVTPIPDPDELVSLLRQAEWAGAGIPARCAWCGHDKPAVAPDKMGREHHTPTCPVAPILYPKEQA